MLKTVSIAALALVLGMAFYYIQYSPAARACQAKGGVYDFQGCWKMTMTKILD